MVFAAVAVALLGFILKAIAAEPAGWFLVPLAGVAGICHVLVHMQAARSERPPIRLAAISDILLLGALLLQIDFGSWNCGHTTIDGVAWIFGWSSEYVHAHSRRAGDHDRYRPLRSRGRHLVAIARRQIEHGSRKRTML